MAKLSKGMQQQLTFVEQIALDSIIGFAQSTHFKQALQTLSDLLNTSLLQVTTIQTDQDNYEYILNKYVYQKPQKRLNHSDVVIRFSDLPKTYKDRSRVKSESLLTSDDIHNNPFVCSETFISSSLEQPIFSIPFMLDNRLVGMVVYQANKQTNFSQNYPAAFQCFRNILASKAREDRQTVKLHTYQTVLDLMPQRVFWKNRDSTYLGCNKAFSDDASLSSPEDIVGATDHEIFPQQADLYRSDDAKTMATREHLISSEEPQTHQSGNTIWLRTSKRPIISSQNHVVGLVGTYDDITQLKLVQHELHNAKSKLEDRVAIRTQALTDSNVQLASLLDQLKSTQIQLIEKEKMAALGGLVAGIAHEINTPIGVAVTGASQLEYMTKYLKESLQKGAISKSTFFNGFDQINQNSSLILRNLARAAELIRNFKMVAVDQSNDEKRPIKLKSYLHDVVTTMTPKSKKNNITICLSGDENITLDTFPGTLAQIATNLIDNAIEHAFECSKKGELNISFYLKSGQLYVSFRDNGIGIKKILLSKIFEPFHTSKRGAGGSGLGLSIVYNLVTQKLGANIQCNSEEGKWTEFIISIPLNETLSVKNLEILSRA